MSFKQKVFDNGLRLVAEKTTSNVVAINMLFNVGSRDEAAHQEGYAHFIEHLIFKGSEKYSAEDVMDRLTFLGADYNAYTSRTTTRYIFKCLKSNFEECFEVYADLLVNTKFDAFEIDKERGVVIEEMKKCDDEPVEVLYRRVMKNYFNGYSFAHDELGEEQIIKNVTREELLAFKQKYYRPENCVVSVSGNIEFDEICRIIEKYYALKFDYKAKPYELNFNEIKPNILEKYDIVKRDDNQANVCIHIKAATLLSNKKYISDIYASILGNSQNSRLFKVLREKLGLVYSVVAFSDVRANSGEIYIVFGTRPTNIKKAIAAVKTEIENLASTGVTEEEILRAKNWKASCLAFAMESSQDRADINGTYVHYFGKPQTIEEKIKCYKNITKKQVDEFAKQIKNEQMFNVVAVGKNIKLSDLQQF